MAAVVAIVPPNGASAPPYEFLLFAIFCLALVSRYYCSSSGRAKRKAKIFFGFHQEAGRESTMARGLAAVRRARPDRHAYNLLHVQQRHQLYCQERPVRTGRQSRSVNLSMGFLCRRKSDNLQKVLFVFCFSCAGCFLPCLPLRWQLRALNIARNSRLLSRFYSTVLQSDGEQLSVVGNCEQTFFVPSVLLFLVLGVCSFGRA